MPPAFILGATALFLRYRLDARRVETPKSSTLKYTITSDEKGDYQIYCHDSEKKQTASELSLLPLPIATPSKPEQKPPSAKKKAN